MNRNIFDDNYAEEFFNFFSRQTEQWKQKVT
jgi:hypothetical protein